MNTQVIKSVPPIDFEEVSIGMPDWQTRFLKLVQQGRPIRYDVYTMPNLSNEIQGELSKRGYHHLLLEGDNDQYFLAPRQ